VHKVTVAIDKRQSPWEWDKTVPLERILFACCQPEEALRPSIDCVLQQLHTSPNPTLEDVTHNAQQAHQPAHARHRIPLCRL